MPEEKLLDLHLQDVNSIVTQLASLGVTIQDKDLVDQMLASLPRSWSTFKAIQQGRDRSPTFSELQGSMLHERSSRVTDMRDSDEILDMQRTERPYRSQGFRDHRVSRASPRGCGRNFKSPRSYKRCGSTTHTAQLDCEVTKIECQIRHLQIQLSRLKTTHSNSYSSINILPDKDSKGDDTHATLNACMLAFTVDEEPWFLDSGASSHVTGNPLLLTNTSHSSVSSICTATRQILLVQHKGNVTFSNHEVKSVKDVLYVLGVKTNLLSVGRFADLGHTIIFNSNKYIICNDTYLPNTVFLEAQ